MARGVSGPAGAVPVVNAISASNSTFSGTVRITGGPNITVGTDASGISISGAAGGGGGIAIAGSNTTYTSGTVEFTGSNIVTIRSSAGNRIVVDASVAAQTVQTQGILSAGVSTGGNTAGSTGVNTGSRLVIVGGGAITASQSTAAGASTITLSGPTQTVQTQNLHNVTISGNTAGAGAAISSGTLTIAGGNNITISQAGNALTISGAAAGGAQTGISSIAASNTTYTSGGITITGSNIVTVRSTTGQGVVIDASQSVQTQGVLSVGASTGGNTAGNTTVNTGSRMVLVGAGAVTLSQTTGAGATTLSISAPTQTAQTGISGLAGSNTTYTSGTVTITGVGGGVTVSSNTGQRIDISVAAPVAQTVQTQNVHNVTLSGNTAGAMAHISSGTMTLAGGNNITLSQAGNAITISGPAAAGAQTGISSIAASNTTYTSGGITITGSNAVTVRSTTGQGIVIDAPTQTVQTQNVAVPAASNTTYTSGTYTITGVGGGVTVSSNTGQRIDISVAAPVAQTVQTQGILSAGVSTGGNTAGNTTVNTGSRLVFVGAGAVSLSQGTGAGASTLTISAPTQTAQTGISGLVGSNATYTSGTVTITGVGGGVTVSSNTGQRIDISVAAPVAQTVQTQNVHNVTLSGNTAGVMAQISSGTLTLAGGNNITLSQNGNAVTISGAAGGGAGFSAGVSNAGNTAGSTGATGTRLVLVGTNNITLSQSTDANGGTVSISGAGGGAGAFSAGVSTGGNTAGATGITGTQNVYVGSSGVTLSQTTGANGGTITIQGPGQWVVPTVSWFDNQAGGRVTATAAYRGVATANGSWFIFPLDPGNDYFPGQMTVNTLRVNMSGSNTVSTASTGSWTLSASFALYTRNGSTLSLLASGSQSIGSGAANASNSSLYQGRRWLTFDTGQFSGSSLTFSQGDYWMGLAFRSSGEAKLISMLGMGAGLHVGSSHRSGFLGVGSSTGSSTMLDVPFLGVYTATSTAAPVSITKGQVARPANTGSANFIPHIVLDNIGVLE